VVDPDTEMCTESGVDAACIQVFNLGRLHSTEVRAPVRIAIIRVQWVSLEKIYETFSASCCPSCIFTYRQSMFLQILELTTFSARRKRS